MEDSPENRLREYVIKTYGKLKVVMASSIKKYTKNEVRKSKCEMCHKIISTKKSFLWEPMMKKMTGGKDLTICEECAKREHGSKNKYKWKDLIKDLDKK